MLRSYNAHNDYVMQTFAFNSLHDDFYNKQNYDMLDELQVSVAVSYSISLLCCIIIMCINQHSGSSQCSVILHLPYVYRTCVSNMVRGLYYLKDRFDCKYLILRFGYPSHFSGTNNCRICLKISPTLTN